MEHTTSYKYIKAYDVLVKAENNILWSGWKEQLSSLGINKLSSLSKLTDEQQRQVIENAPLEEMIISHV